MGINNPHEQLIKMCMENQVNCEIAAVHVNVDDNTIKCRDATTHAIILIIN